jgi:hypothetical protein
MNMQRATLNTYRKIHIEELFIGPVWLSIATAFNCNAALVYGKNNWCYKTHHGSNIGVWTPSVIPQTFCKLSTSFSAI